LGCTDAPCGPFDSLFEKGRNPAISSQQPACADPGTLRSLDWRRSPIRNQDNFILCDTSALTTSGIAYMTFQLLSMLLCCTFLSFISTLQFHAPGCDIDQKLIVNTLKRVCKVPIEQQNTTQYRTDRYQRFRPSAEVLPRTCGDSLNHRITKRRRLHGSRNHFAPTAPCAVSGIGTGSGIHHRRHGTVGETGSGEFVAGSRQYRG